MRKFEQRNFLEEIKFFITWYKEEATVFSKYNLPVNERN